MDLADLRLALVSYCELVCFIALKDNFSAFRSEKGRSPCASLWASSLTRDPTLRQ